MTDMKISLTKNRFLFIRRACCMASLVGTMGMLFLMIFGCIPIAGRTLTIRSALNFLFYILDIGARPFISIAIHIGLAIFYYIVCAKIVVAIVSQIKLAPLWFKSSFDSEPTRNAASRCIQGFETAVFAFFLEIILSKVFLGGRLSSSTLILLVVLGVVAWLISATYFYIMNRDLLESVLVSFCRWFMVGSAVIFTFLVCSTDVASLWNSIGKFFIVLSFSGLGADFVWDTLINTVVFPLFQLIAVWRVLKIAYYTVRRQEARDLTKSFLKYACIVLVIVAIFNGLIISSRDPVDYLNMFIKDILFVLVPLFIYLLSKNLFTLSQSVPYMNDEDRGDAGQSVDENTLVAQAASAETLAVSEPMLQDDAAVSKNA